MAEMATENTPRDAATEDTETGTQDNQTTGQEATDETSGQASGSTEDNGTATSQEQAGGDSTTDGSQEKDSNKDALLADLAKERKRRQELTAQVEKLQAEAQATRSSQNELTAIQRKYDRLESFLTSVGGPLSKALDSRSFTQALFESDEDVQDLVTKWHRDNPSAVTQALNSGSGPGGKSADMNALLRAAIK